MCARLEFRTMSEEWAVPLAEFFAELLANGEDKNFHPHPLTLQAARRIAELRGRDLYFVVVEGKCVVGYGMLRGWDEGFETPSLGIALSSKVRGIGLGTAFMSFLHLNATRAGAKAIRLKVYSTNAAAVALYKKLGYAFTKENAEEMVGLLLLR